MLRYALYDYIPQRYLRRATFEQIDLDRRILDFKNGRGYAIRWAAREMARTLSLMDLHDTIIVCIPACCKRTNNIRFKNFSEILSERLGTVNGFGHIIVNGHRQKVHISHVHELADGVKECYHIDEDFFRGKNVLVVDDITTTGKTANAFVKRMESIGANVRMAIFLAKTHNFNRYDKY
jgi:predicted amidophosphoribosyltransferase